MKIDYKGLIKIAWSDLMNLINQGTINVPMEIKHNKKAFPNTRIEIRAINNAWRSREYLHIIYGSRNLITPVTKEIAKYKNIKISDEELKSFVDSLNWLKSNGIISKKVNDDMHKLRKRSNDFIHNNVGIKKITYEEANWYMSVLNDLINNIL